jgi:hypothetical protein
MELELHLYMLAYTVQFVKEGAFCLCGSAQFGTKESPL